MINLKLIILINKQLQNAKSSNIFSNNINEKFLPIYISN